MTKKSASTADERYEEAMKMLAEFRTTMELINRYVAMVQSLFTQEDANGLRHIASLVEGEAKRRLVLSLADRIEILIPPTDGTK